MAILERQRFHITSEYDQVILSIGNLVVPMPYAASFKIALGLRLNATTAMRCAKEDITGWEKFANENIPETQPYTVSEENRKTVPRGFAWKAGWEGENVKVLFGNNELHFHFTTALQISARLRIAGARAKAWAGDTSMTMNAAGILSDAEENYRLGLN